MLQKNKNDRRVVSKTNPKQSKEILDNKWKEEFDRYVSRNKQGLNPFNFTVLATINRWDDPETIEKYFQ